MDVVKAVGVAKLVATLSTVVAQGARVAVRTAALVATWSEVVARGARVAVGMVTRAVARAVMTAAKVRAMTTVRVVVGGMGTENDGHEGDGCGGGGENGKSGGEGGSSNT